MMARFLIDLLIPIFMAVRFSHSAKLTALSETQPPGG